MREYGVAISCHAPYYINLARPEDAEAEKSFPYVKQSIDAVKLLGGTRVVFHPGIVYGTREESADAVIRRLEKLLGQLADDGTDGFTLCPETMGRPSQVGSYAEIVRICGIDPHLIPCFDFGHINTFGNGALKTADDYRRVIDCLFAGLPEQKAKNLHIHFSKIMYGKAGEIKHLDMSDTVFGPDFEPLARLIAEYKMTPTVICESRARMAEDALLLRGIYDII
jgi:deoxyribonuclease-4